MHSREFERRLKKLNSHLHVYRGLDDSKHAGIWADIPTYHGSEVEELCGIPKGEIPEWSILTPQGKMIIGGWNRVLKMLVSKKLINLPCSVKYFGYWYEHRQPNYQISSTPIDAAISNMQIEMKKIENPLVAGQMIETQVFKKDDIVDVGRMIAKEK